MIALTVTSLAVWLLLLAAPDIPLARCCRRLLVERPARAIGRITRGHVASACLLLTVGALMIWLLEDDGVRLLSLMAPEIVGWLTMFEISVYLDALVAVVALSSAVRLRGVRRRLTALRPRAVATSRARRRRSVRRAAAADADDGGSRRPPGRQRRAAA